MRKRMPALIGGFGNFLLPLMVGGPDMANLKKFYSFSPRYIISILNQIKIYSTYTNVNLFSYDHIGSYLARLFEGDGHIWISKPNSNSKNLSLSITFHLKDLPLAEKLKDVLGHGWIRIKKEDNACVLIFHTKDGLIFIISLMNFYLRSPKLLKFNELIDNLKTRYNVDIEKHDFQTQDFSKDGWLGGFIDADGSFGIIFTKKEMDELSKTTKKRKVGCRFRIEQRMICPYSNLSYEPLFTSIAKFLNVNLNITNRVGGLACGGKQYFNVTAKSRNSLRILKEYFNTYSLFSSKHLDYKDWLKVVDFILAQSHYEEDNLEIIEELKNNMNHNRSYFNWQRLDVLGYTRQIKKSSAHLFPSVLGTANSLFFLLNKIKLRVYYSDSANARVNINNSSNKNLGSYLAGLFEGDGHIWIQKKGSKTHNPRFCITFGLKNEALCQKLLNIIGSGFIRYKHGENACVLVVSPVVGLKKIVNLINGELKTPKIHQLHSLIDWLNKNHNAQLEKLPLNKDNLENSGWLSGYVDADGSFSVQYTKTEDVACAAKKRKISCRLRIEQRMLDPITNESYYDILNQICLFLNCNLCTRTQKSTNNSYYTLAATSKVSLAIAINYFNKYPLFTSKYLDYKDWEQVANLLINNQHLTDEGINTVELVRSRMNTKRIEFNWDHLKNFYD